MPGQDLTGLEHQLRTITSQIASLHQPYEDGRSALRGDLAEVGRALAEAMPRRAVEALEAEVREAAERIDHTRNSGGDTASLAGLEQGLAEVRDALRHLAPAENLVGFEEAVRGLSRKIDQIGSVQQDPSTFHQLEQAIAQMRGIVSHVASDDALAPLAAGCTASRRASAWRANAATTRCTIGPDRGTGRQRPRRRELEA